MAKKTIIRSRFDEFETKGLTCGEGLTQQHFKDECDINYLIRHFQDIPRPEPIYGDVSAYSDLQSAIDIVNNAEEDFMLLPSEIRDRFANNPVDFYNFANDPNNLEEMYDLGLAIRPQKNSSPSSNEPPANLQTDYIAPKSSDSQKSE